MKRYAQTFIPLVLLLVLASTGWLKTLSRVRQMAPRRWRETDSRASSDNCQQHADGTGGGCTGGAGRR